jgi:pterin-4a-carbinolamine dehydratase
MDEDLNVSKLLRLKRYEKPPPAYFDDFLREFQRRQRVEALRRPGWAIFWDRLVSIAPTFRVPQFAYAVIFMLAAAASALIVTHQPAGTLAQADDSRTSFSLTASKPVTITDTLPVSAQTGGSLPSHYVLQARPVSNEQPLSF